MHKRFSRKIEFEINKKPCPAYLVRLSRANGRLPNYHLVSLPSYHLVSQRLTACPVYTWSAPALSQPAQLTLGQPPSYHLISRLP